MPLVLPVPLLSNVTELAAVAGIVTGAEPSKSTPLICTGVASFVVVAEFPVTLIPQVPVALVPVILGAPMVL